MVYLFFKGNRPLFLFFGKYIVDLFTFKSYNYGLIIQLELIYIPITLVVS
jgi:hypothetical protein